MRKMKKYIISSFLAIIFILSGCYDLDRAPFDKPSSSTFWKTEAQCKQGIMGVYASLKNNDLYGKMFLIDINSDVAVGYDEYEPLMIGTCTPRTGFLNGKWKNGYDAIQKANTALRNLGVADIPDNVKQTMIAEAKFLRALVYFHLLDYFGGLPLYDETTNLELEFNQLLKPRSTIEETRAFILKDLTDVINSSLPISWPASDYGRVTKGAVYALRGKVNLYNKSYAEAIKDFEEVIDPKYNYALYPKYEELFKPFEGHVSSEMIFSIVNVGGISTPYGMPFCFYAGSRATFNSWNNSVPSSGLVEMYEYKDGRPFNWEEIFPGYTNADNAVKEKVYRVTIDLKTLKRIPVPEEAAAEKKLLDMYAQRDPRLNATVILPFTQHLGWVNNAEKMMTFYFGKDETGKLVILSEKDGYFRNNKGWDSYYWRKYIPEGNWKGLITDRAHTPVNFSIIRLADVYLMLAEAYNEVGRSSEAVTYINKIRSRAGIALLNSGPDYLKAMSKEEVFERIVKERAYELAGEGIRDSDLRRWRRSHLILNHKEFSILGKQMTTRKFNENRDYLWPIPAGEIEYNPELKQNPSW